ncbi:MAG: hypothetical protein KF822_06840 [Steroidobacteraceae bacterium]|nr:hypothetical protein [Steroidobacteraceae bacterium]
MDNFILALKVPAIQFALLAAPMLFILDGRLLHRLMTDQFARYVALSLPIALSIAVAVAITHSERYAMGVAVMAPYLQWGGVNLLYRHFVRTHGRLPRSPSEHEQSDTGFRIAANMLLVGLPLLAFMIVAKIQSGGGPN